MTRDLLSRKPSLSIHLLGRRPEPGVCKTRLISVLGAEGAANAHARLLTHVAGMLRRWCSDAPLGRLYRLWVTSAESTPFLDTLADACQRRVQPEGDLGARLTAIARIGLAEAEAVLLVGGDAVSLDIETLDHTESLLSSHDAVLIPAEDGGYVALALKRFHPDLFCAMPWGTAGVAEETRTVFRRLGWSWKEIPGHWDVDFPEEWERFRRLENNWSDNCFSSIVSGEGRSGEPVKEGAKKESLR
ncbi:MAG: TIGR04282 family arsenosugar biosynthesis glycosyltransferase [Magnetococcales bacterium]|nr:TIGR04282 family arsenosugar biosynthesis glycosyltransferase [Magnetococcales bacterium]